MKNDPLPPNPTKNKTPYEKLLLSLTRYLLVFLLVAFVITCSVMLFVQIMSGALEITLTDAIVEKAAKLTFLNVLLLSLLLAVADLIRRRITVNRPVKKITDAAQKMMQGDFSVRIPYMNGIYAGETFNEIIEYLNKMAEELSGTETLRSDFVANVSHELKTPLTVIQNYATMLQSTSVTDEQRIEYSRAIAEACRRQTSLITNILKLSKLENQQISPVCREYDLSEQVIGCLLSFEDIIEKKELEIETDIDDGIKISSDPEMLTLVWNNLFSNAIKFTDEKGKISLTVKDGNEYASVRIADTGCGISAEVGARMFDKFYQGDTSHSTQGNGLGLALVRRVIEITGCDISVESELGAGTAFTVKIRKEL